MFLRVKVKMIVKARKGKIHGGRLLCNLYARYRITHHEVKMEYCRYNVAKILIT